MREPPRKSVSQNQPVSTSFPFSGRPSSAWLTHWRLHPANRKNMVAVPAFAQDEEAEGRPNLGSPDQVDTQIESDAAPADPLLKLAFNRIGSRAAAGLIEALDGQRVETPA